MKNRYSKKLVAIAIASSTLLLTACDSDDDDDSPNIQGKAFTSVMMDSATQTDYLNLVTGQQVAETGTWHIAINRTSIKLNSNVAAALADEQAEYYDATGNPDTNLLTNLLPEDEENSLLNFSDASSLVFISDSLQLAVEDWYNYNFMTHVVTPNTDNNWIVQSAAGNSYAKLSTTNIVQAGHTFTTTFEFDVQAVGTSSFAGSTTATFVYDSADPKTCFDFDNNTTASCSGSDWDVAVEGTDFTLNGGDSGSGSAAAFGPLSTTDIASYTNGTTFNSQDFTRAYSTDLIGGVFSDELWYAYNLLGGHKLWPNYRVYVIDTDTTSSSDEPVKLQLVNYYDDNGTSGYVTVRFMPVSQTN